MHAARKLFSNSPYSAVSMSAIAEEAGVSKANLYHHFPSKDALFMAVLRCACSDSAALLSQVSGESGDVRRSLKSLALRQLHNMQADPEGARLVLREIFDSGPERGKLLAEQILRDNFSAKVRMLRSAQNRGELKADVDPAFVLFMISAANIMYFQSREVMKHLPDVTFAEDADRFGDLMADFLACWLVPERGPGP